MTDNPTLTQKINKVLELLECHQQELDNIEQIRNELTSTLITTIDARIDYIFNMQKSLCSLRIENTETAVSDAKLATINRIDDVKEEFLRDVSQLGNSIDNQLKIIDNKIDVHISERIRVGKELFKVFITSFGTILLALVLSGIDRNTGNYLHSFFSFLIK